MFGILAAILVLAGETPQIMPPPPSGLPPSAAEASAKPDLMDYYPARALRLEREGLVELGCQIQADGSVGPCEVVSETPSDFGFGQAALRMSRRFRMTPEIRDGKPVASGPVRIPIAFKLPDAPPPAAPRPVPLTYEEAVMCHGLFTRRVLYREPEAARQAAARTLALNLGQARGLSVGAVERRLKRDPGAAVYNDQQLARCETVPKPPAG